MHLMIMLPKEFYFEDQNFIEIFNKHFDYFSIDLNEMYEFLKFELKHLYFLLKLPEIYCCIIEKIEKILISLSSQPEFSFDDKNFVVFQAKFAEFFNCAIFFLKLPFILEKKKKFRSSKNNVENKKDFLIFTPKYCVSCGKKIPIRSNLFSVRHAFNIIICKNCDLLIDPYYENDDEVNYN